MLSILGLQVTSYYVLPPIPVVTLLFWILIFAIESMPAKTLLEKCVTFEFVIVRFRMVAPKAPKTFLWGKRKWPILSKLIEVWIPECVLNSKLSSSRFTLSAPMILRYSNASKFMLKKALFFMSSRHRTNSKLLIGCCVLPFKMFNSSEPSSSFHRFCKVHINDTSLSGGTSLS